MRKYIDFDLKTKEIIISNVAINRLLNRIDETYRSSSGYKQIKGANIKRLFNSINYISWDKTEIRFYSFFALEFYEMFSFLYEEYNDKTYAEVAQELWDNTWISNYTKKSEIPNLNLSALSKFTIQPKDFQLEFIKKYPELRYIYDLEGYILSFEQGLGKTFTAVALAECLNKDRVYIVCPNSVKNVWASEIKKYYKDTANDDPTSEKIWKNRVHVISKDKKSDFYDSFSTIQYIIINQESIPDIFKLVKSTANSMIIVDESHNFRGINTKRVKSLLELKEKAECVDCLLMSGTPLKATANELTPALRMIDPHFTEKLAKLYDETFTDSSTEAAQIVKARFIRVIYRKVKKDVLGKTLPEKFISELILKVPHEERFGLNKIKDEITKAFHKEYVKRIESGIFTENKKSLFYRSSAGSYNFLTERAKFENVVRKYARTHSANIESYLRFIFQDYEDSTQYELVTTMNAESKYFDFLKKHVIPYVKTAEEKEIVTTRIDGIYGWFVAAKWASGSIMGKTLAEYKNNCFQQIWKYNHDELIDIIKKGKKKTIIFTVLVPTAEYVYNDLKSRGISCVKVTGSDAGRQKLIDKFREDPNVEVLVATTQTLSLGVTLTEANQIIFLGTPYRSSDFEQATDRIHRIGQDENCYIYNVLLWSREKNITGRIEEIMNWSEEMFDSLINESADLSEYKLYLELKKNN